METIDEGATGYKNQTWAESVVCEWDSNELKQFCESDFKAGVEFAQRWIPVEEELPTPNQWLIVKKHNGLKLGMYYDAEKRFMSGSSDQTRQVTHWRPIEFK